MIAVAELKQENRGINDLRNVLAVLVKDTAMHSNSIFCELLERFQARLNHHLKHEPARFTRSRRAARINM
jgi:predicted GIY-YIG superfamily endonuclease